MLGVRPAECLMVGDDPDARHGSGVCRNADVLRRRQGGEDADYRGDLGDLAALLPSLAGPQPG